MINLFLFSYKIIPFVFEYLTGNFLCCTNFSSFPPIYLTCLCLCVAPHSSCSQCTSQQVTNTKNKALHEKIQGLDLLKQDSCDNDLHSESLGYDCTGSQSIHYESDTGSRSLQTIPFSFGKKLPNIKNWREFISSQSPTDSEHKNM